MPLLVVESGRYSRPSRACPVATVPMESKLRTQLYCWLKNYAVWEIGNGALRGRSFKQRYRRTYSPDGPSRAGPTSRGSARGDSTNRRGPPKGGWDGRPSDSPLLAGSAGPVVYRLSKLSERAEFDRKVENCGAK